MRASFLHCFKAFCGNHYRDFFAEFGNEKSLFLQIDLAAAFPSRIEFSRADAVGISPAN